MASGWSQVADAWYYADASGAMADDRWVGLLPHLLWRHGHKPAGRLLLGGRRRQVGAGRLTNDVD